MLKIYLGDLTYDTVKTNHVLPLNVACNAAYVKEKYPREVDIKIFKYPKELEAVLKNNPPDMLGLSNYTWNARLNLFFIEMAKRLNPGVITVMGGPNIRTDVQDIQDYLSMLTLLDYYILYEGEKPFGDLVGAIIAGNSKPLPPQGCAAIINGEFLFENVIFAKEPGEIDLPSPYIGGLLDSFLANTNMIPLLETNRGCPFGCVYCTWGISALSRVRQKPLELVYEEIDYVSKKSSGQVNWIFCDANFGVLPRDVDIARKIRAVMDKNGHPLNVTFWHSKNTSKRNIEISKILKENRGLIAMQSADPIVLKNSGRKNINTKDIKKYVEEYRDNALEVNTEIMLGLPGETAESHLNTLVTAFDAGFDGIYPYNIRMLPGSKLESVQYRRMYGIKTKYRPIFGAYGIYDGRFMFEIEESVRATKDMTESALDSFKIVHWLIYFAWNTGVFKPVLRFAQRYGVNSGLVLHKLSYSNHPLLKEVFEEMRKKSMSEWFTTPEEMIQFYERPGNFNRLINNFTKLSLFYIAFVYKKADIFSALQTELFDILKTELKEDKRYCQTVLDSFGDFMDKYICKDLLQGESCVRKRYLSEVVSITLNDPGLLENNTVEIDIYRPKQYVDFCKYYLNSGGKRDLSSQNLSRFFEIGGIEMLTNKVRVSA